MSRCAYKALPLLALLPFTALAAADKPQAAATAQSARFALCSGAHRVTCVVDGDTFWYRGAKIRIADINAPEVSQPSCAREAALGERATGRLLGWLNAGPFVMQAAGRERDRYGRMLRTVTRDGVSVGEDLVRAGLAERWKGYRGNWC